jgi:CheY-like chemotaxis protein
MSESGKKKILVADDSPSIRRFVEVVLTKAGFEVISAEDGRDALKKAFDNDVDAVITDVEMPNLTGPELFRILRADPEKGKLRLIMMSGLSPEFGEKPATGDADIFLEKDGDLKHNLLTALDGLP